jgi:OmpA-OmpF porin, OOP family
MLVSGRHVRQSIKTCAIAMPLILASSLAMAQDSGFYLGANIGRSYGDVSSGNLAEGLRASGHQVTELDSDDRDTAWKVYGGYDFNRYLAAELNYFDLGSYSFDALLAPPQNFGGKADISGYGLDLVGKIPVNERLTGLLRAGITRTEVSESFYNSLIATPVVGLSNQTEKKSKNKLGVGLEYKFTDNLSGRAEWERYRLPASQFIDNSANTATLGLVYRFGRAAPAPVVQTPAPAPARPTPPPAPAPAQPVVVNLEASALFDFDKTEIKPAGRQELDNLVRQINGMSYDSVIVIGHTDRIGTREYNQALSERRANAVRDYLVRGGIQANRITSRGVANDQPTTRPTDCRGLGSNQATIDCLAPDRRVVVEIHATRQP